MRVGIVDVGIVDAGGFSRCFFILLLFFLMFVVYTCVALIV